MNDICMNDIWTPLVKLRQRHHGLTRQISKKTFFLFFYVMNNSVWTISVWTRIGPPWLNYVSGPRPNAPDLKNTFFFVVVLCTLVKLRRGRLNYVGGEISPETDLRYTKIFENFATVFFFCEYSLEADLSYTKKLKTFARFVCFFFPQHLHFDLHVSLHFNSSFIYIAIYISWYFS